MSSFPTVSRPSSSPAFRVGQLVTVENRPHIVVKAWRGTSTVDEDMDGRAKHYASVRVATDAEISAAAASPSPAPTRAALAELHTLIERNTTDFTALSTLAAGPEVADVLADLRFRMVDGIVWYMAADRDGDVRGSSDPAAVALFTTLAA